MYKLLIVEDEQLTRNFLKQIIPKLCDKWEIVGDVMDGVDALEVLKHQSVDLILTDIKMPVMDGLELCKQVNKLYPEIHCAILSGYGEFDYAKSAIKYNVNSYLLKPIINDELRDMLVSIADICHKEQSDKIKFNDLILASNKYQEAIISKFLKAVITDSHIEVQSLYPILYDLNVNLFDAEAIIVILQITEDMLIKNNIKISNLILLKLLLFNTAKKHTKDISTKVFIDSNENTVLLIPIDEDCDFKKIITDIYEKIDNGYYKETDLHLFSIAGTKENELLQLNVSYENAKKAFLQTLFTKDEPSNIQLYSEQSYQKNIKALHSYMANLIYTLHNNDTINQEVLSKDIGNFLYEQINDYYLLKTLNYIISQLKINIPLNEDVINKVYKVLIDSKDSLTDKKNISAFIINMSNIIIENLHKKNSMCDENLLIEQTKQFIYKHYMEPISLSLIADELCISYSYLSNLFHELEGQSYIKFLTKVRLKHAANLLKNNDLKLDYITKKVGYISVKHFSYVFKKYYGISPGEYRKRLF
jgi:two-component system response regulator YesN